MKKMQTLTVNGNAYQVSDPEAVSFAAAQTLTEEQKLQARKNIGMGGQYQLIEDVTLDENVTSFVRAADPKGVAYDFSAVRIYIRVPIYDGSDAASQIIFGLDSFEDTNMIYHQASNPISSSKEKRLYMVARNDCGLIEYSLGVAEAAGSANLLSKPSPWVYPWGNIIKIKLTAYSDGKVIPAGTRIAIYAVRG